MTTIAYRDGILAADSCSWSGGARRRTRKVFKVRSQDGRSFLVGFSGSGTYSLAILAWMRGQTARPEPLQFIKPDELQNQCALVIDDRRRIWQLGSDLQYSLMREKFYAYGGGQDFVWGALEAGASAVQAVRIAMKRSDYAGLGVDAVRFA